MRCHQNRSGIERISGLEAPLGNLVRLLALALFMVLGACASTSGGGQDTSETGEGAEPENGQATVVVDNDLLPSSSVSVWLVWESGRQVLVGAVGPGQRRELEYAFPRGVANFRFRARPTGGDEIVSNTFSLYPRARVHWALRANVAVVVEGREP